MALILKWQPPIAAIWRNERHRTDPVCVWPNWIVVIIGGLSLVRHIAQAWWSRHKDDYVPASTGVGVTEPICSVPLFFKFSKIIKTLLTYWRSHTYLANMDVIQRIWDMLWYFSKIQNFSLMRKVMNRAKYPPPLLTTSLQSHTWNVIYIWLYTHIIKLMIAIVQLSFCATLMPNWH